VQFLPIIALQTAQEILFNQNHDPLLNPQNYTAAIQSLGAEHSIVYKGKIVTGWAKVSNNISPTGSSPIWVNDPDSVWLEGTLEGVCALYILGEKTRADNILDSILAIQDQTTGGLSSIVDDLNRAWPYNFAYLGLDATSALISALQYRVNAQGNYLVKAKYKLSSSVDSAQLIFTVRNIHIEDNKPLKIEGHLQHVNPEDGLVAVSPQKEYLASVASCVAILVYDQQGRAVGFRHYSSFGFNPGIFQKEFKDFLNNEYHFVIIRGSRDIMERQAAYTRQLSDYLINTSKLSKANIFFYDSDKYNNLPNAFGVLVVLRKTGNVTVTFTDISTRYRYGQEEIVPVAPSGRRDEAMIVLEKVIAGLIGQLNPKNRALFESKYRVEDLLKWFGLYANAFLSERALIDFLKRSFWELNVPEPATPFALWDEERASIEKGFDSIVAELNETQEKIPITIATFGIGKQKKDLIETARIALERLSAYKDRVEIQLVGIDKQGEILAEPMDFNSITEDHGWQNRIHYHAFFGDIRNKALWEHLAQKIKPNIILFRYNWTAKSVEQGEFIEAMTRHSSFGFVVARQNGSPWAETKVFNNKKSMAAAQGKSAAMTAEGGIDFKPDKVGPAFFIQNNGEESIRFHMDPAMLAKLQNASGFVPVIITIRPMEDIQSFLGLNGQK
jgi:hypothetical protein